VSVTRALLERLARARSSAKLLGGMAMLMDLKSSPTASMGQRERLAAAYRRRARAVAYRATNATQIDQKKSR
jgi:hypothetical protein